MKFSIVTFGCRVNQADSLHIEETLREAGAEPSSTDTADLVVVNGNPAVNIADIRNVETVFKQGVGFDPAKLIESVRGRVGLW